MRQLFLSEAEPGQAGKQCGAACITEWRTAPRIAFRGCAARFRFAEHCRTSSPPSLMISVTIRAVKFAIDVDFKRPFFDCSARTMSGPLYLIGAHRGYAQAAANGDAMEE